MERGGAEALPGWDKDGIFDVAGRQFRAGKERLAALLTMAEALEAAPGGGPTLTELARVTDEARSLAWTLLTATRGALSISSSDVLASAERREVLRLSGRAERAALRLRGKLLALPPDTPELAEPALSAQMSPFALPDPFYGEKESLRERVYEPLSLLYRQLRSRMLLTLDPEAPGEAPRRFSFSQAISILKNSDDPRLRRAVFCSMNAWIAERGELFADLQNAVEGCREEAQSRARLTSFGYTFSSERIDPGTYAALFSAIRKSLPELRLAVSARAPVFGRGRLHASLLFAPPPAGYAGEDFSRGPESIMTMQGLLLTIRRALTPAIPFFDQFVADELRGHWIEARRFSNRTGGGWCDNLPSLQAVAVFADVSPGMPSAFWLSHLLGVAGLHRLLLQAPAPLRHVPLTVVETAGMLAVTALEQYFYRKFEGGASERAALWFSMMTITNELITIPFRHELAVRIQAEQSRRRLAARDFNRLTSEVWGEYFGDTTESLDEYIWAYKHHFYQMRPFYDFQYSFGFLAARQLLAHFESGRGGDHLIERFFLALSRGTWEEACAKVLGEDIRRPAFWEEAIGMAIAPLRRLEASPQLLAHFQGRL